MLVSEELALNVISYKLYDTNHGSDHEVREIILNISVPEQVVKERLLFRNALWNKIYNTITTKLATIPARGNIQEQTDQLIIVVLNIVNTLISRVKHTPYVKRWWISDLTRLYKEYT